MSNVIVRHYDFASPKVDERLVGLRITHLSDLHLRRWSGTLQQASQKLAAAKPHLVVLTGDFDDRCLQPAHSADLLKRFLEPIHAPMGCFGVLGNHDDPSFASHLSGCMTLLNNENVVLQSPCGGSICLAGVDGRTDTSWDIPAALTGIDATQLTIFLSHYPTVAFHLPRHRVDLLLTGHTHAGQCRLPFIGPPWLLVKGWPRRYAWGWHNVDGTPTYVNGGIGCSCTVPIRLFCPPEIAIITLRASN